MRSGFGRGPFGSGAFGQSDIPTAILWDTTPQFNRAVARAGASGATLESLRRAEAQGLNQRIVRPALSLPLLRDPVAVRDQDTATVTVTITNTTLVPTGDADTRSYNLAEVSDPGDLGPVEPGWLLRYAGKAYPVRAVEKRSNAFSFYADEPLPTGEYTISAPGMLLALAKDFGLDLDGYDYARYQRSVLVAPWRLFNLKGTAQGATVRAAAGGFEAEVHHLYRVASTLIGYLDAADVYLIGGAYYTTVPPRFPRMDDITADYLLPSGTPITDNPCFVERIEWPLTVTGSADNGDGTWTLTVVEDAGMVASPSRWFMVDAAGTQTVVTGVDAAAFEVTVASQTDPGTGSFMLRYSCPVAPSCDYCPSHSVLVVLRVVDPVLAADAIALERAYERMLDKIRAMLSIHVTIKATLFEISSTATAEAAVTSTAEVL